MKDFNSRLDVRIAHEEMWAVSAIRSDVRDEARTLIRDGEPQLLEGLMFDAWSSEWGSGRLADTPAKVRNIGERLGYANRFEARGLAISRALEGHRSGWFEAPINHLIQQIDGIVHDCTGMSFFARPPSVRQAQVWTDPDDGPCLEALQDAFSKERNAIAHGRRLHYWTATNSVRWWALFDSVLGYCHREAERAVSIQLPRSA